MAVRILPLGSGSRGNATLIDAGRTKLLVDAGLSAKAVTTRLEAVGISPRALSAVVLTHEHTDHASGSERLSKRHGVPVVCSRATLAAMDRSPVHFAEWIDLPDGAEIELGEIRIAPFPVPHDAAQPVGLVLCAGGVRIGLATDLGHATTLIVERLRGCEALIVESNHDARMLRDGPYPWHLKQRVAGRMGHLSNDEAASLIRAAAGPDCRAVVLAHLSEKNNTQELARAAAARALESVGARRVTMRVAQGRRPTPAVDLG